MFCKEKTFSFHFKKSFKSRCKQSIDSQIYLNVFREAFSVDLIYIKLEPLEHSAFKRRSRRSFQKAFEFQIWYRSFYLFCIPNARQGRGGESWVWREVWKKSSREEWATYTAAINIVTNCHTESYLPLLTTSLLSLPTPYLTSLFLSLPPPPPSSFFSQGF